MNGWPCRMAYNAGAGSWSIATIAQNQEPIVQKAD
jgi:hypothetical protein